MIWKPRVLCSLFVAAGAVAMTLAGSHPSTPAAAVDADMCIPSSGFIGYLYGQPAYGTTHAGVDIWTLNNQNGTPPGNPVYSAAAGTLKRIYDSSFNEVDASDPAATIVVIGHNIGGEELYTWYIHMADENSATSYINPSLEKDAFYPKGTFLGYQGNRLVAGKGTGGTVTVHLHFAVNTTYLSNKWDDTRRDPSGFLGVDLNWPTPPAWMTPITSNCAAGNAATVTDIPNPDAYSCSKAGFLDFEGLPDETNLSALSISGIRFTTTNGYTWVVADSSTGKYNAKYPNGAYMLKGTHVIWLGTMQGSGRVDFTGGPTSYFSVLTSNYSQVYLDAYDAGNHLLATAGPAGNNLNTGHMAELKITRATPDIAYVMIHDTADFWIADAICTNAPGVPGTIDHLVDNTHRMQTGDHASGNFLLNLVAGVKYYLHILVGPFFSDVDLVLTRPDGTIVAAGDPGVIYDKGTNSIEVGIDDAQAGEWHYEIIANQLEAGGEDIHITVDVESILVDNTPPTLTIPADQVVQYSDPLTFGVSASDLDAGDVLTLSASGLPATLTFVDNGDGTGAVSGTAQVAAGSYPVTFSVSDGVNAPVSAGLNIVVGKEDATLAYSGDALVKKGSPVMLKASVSEVPDGSPGDISQAAVFFDVTAGIGGGTTTYGPVPVSAGGEATWTLASGLAANVYSVDVRMDPANAYYQAPPADTAALVVYDPSAGFTTGGGWVMDGAGKGNFGFNVKYLKKGTSVQGQALYVYRDSGTLVRVKSNSMQWLVVNGSTAAFRGKATVNGGGNYTFEITVVDNGEPGRSDTFAIKIWQPDGTLLHEVSPMTLGGGNVIVPQPKGR